MKQEINCDIIRDLLPLYLDGLASQGSVMAVEEHLETCEDCRTVFEDMKRPLPVEPEDSKVVDGLKKFRRSLKLRTVILLFLAVVLFAGLVKGFLIGRRLEFGEINIERWTYNGDGTVTLDGTVRRGEAFRSFVVTEWEEDRLYLSVSSVLPSPLYSNRDFSIVLPMKPGGVIMWKDHEEVLPLIRESSFATLIQNHNVDIPYWKGGWTVRHTAQIEQIFANAKETTIPQPDTPTEKLQIDITLGSHTATNEDLWDDDWETWHYVYERDGRYYLEEIRAYYGGEREIYYNKEEFYYLDDIEGLDDGMYETHYRKVLTATFPGREYIREISEQDYLTLLQIIDEIEGEQDRS